MQQEPGGPPRPRDPATAWRLAVALAGMIVVLGLATVLVSMLGGGGGDASATSPVVSSAVTAQPPSAPQEQLRATPALRIHPQRAQAGPPLELQVHGIGCPGSSGVLTITEAGSASGTGGADRLVVRRRFDVLPDHSFRATPSLVGQPPGSYRVSIACERYRTAEAFGQLDPRQIFELTEVLELTGPTAAREFVVSPAQATPGTSTQFGYAGQSCVGPGARVEVRLFPPSAMARGPVVLLSPSVVGGSWQGVTTVPAAAAYGTYTLEASCSDNRGLQFRYVTRHVHFGEMVLAVEPTVSTWDDLLDNLGIRLKPVVPAAETAVAAKPSDTG